MMSNVDDVGPAVRVSAFVRSIRDQLGELLAGLPDLSGDERVLRVERVADCVVRRIAEMSPDELARVWAIFGHPADRDPTP